MICPKCANVVASNLRICPRCGADVAPRGFQRSAEQEPQTTGVETKSNTSGQGNNLVIPEEIKGWNWGAALLPYIWGLSHKAYIITILAYITAVLIPIGGALFWLVAFGMRGNEWAWRNKKWESVEKFQAKQRVWRTWGFIIFPIAIILLLARILRIEI